MLVADALSHSPLYKLDEDSVHVEHVDDVGQAAHTSARDHGLLVAPDGTDIPISRELFDALNQVREQIERGQAVQIVVYEKELTTGQAAEMVNVSRQYLVRLLDQGEIPYTKTGTHRRLLLQDVLAFRKRRDAARHKAINDVARASLEAGVY